MSGSGQSCRVLQTISHNSATAQFAENCYQNKIEMGIFTNPSDVPEPGPPPKKETVRVELSGCGFLVKYHFNDLLYNKFDFFSLYHSMIMQFKNN